MQKKDKAKNAHAAAKKACRAAKRSQSGPGHVLLCALAGFGVIAAIPGTLTLAIAGASAGTAVIEAAKAKLSKTKKKHGKKAKAHSGKEADAIEKDLH